MKYVPEVKTASSLPTPGPGTKTTARPEATTGVLILKHPRSIHFNQGIMLLGQTGHSIKNIPTGSDPYRISTYVSVFILNLVKSPLLS
jgi:hypothetical protein